MVWQGRVGLACHVGVTVWQGLCVAGQHGEGVTVAGAEVAVWRGGACVPCCGGITAGWQWWGLACCVRVAPCQGLCTVGQHGGGVAWLGWWQ